MNESLSTDRSLLVGATSTLEARAVRSGVTFAGVIALLLSCSRDRRGTPISSEPTRPVAATTAAPADEQWDYDAAANPDIAAKLAAIGCPSGVCNPRNDDPALIRCCRRREEIMRADPKWSASGGGSAQLDDAIYACVLMLENAKATNPAGVDATVKCMDSARDAKEALRCMLSLSTKDSGT